MSVTAIDFEASCLPRHGRSFPVEVGIADERGVRSWLIRPDGGWADWGWSAEAEALHGITRARLHREGQTTGDVMRQLSATVAGRRLVADSHLDRVWMATLATSGGLDAPPIDHVGQWLDRFGSTDAEIAAAQALLAPRSFTRHRAGGDAGWLFAMLDTLDEAARDRAMQPDRTWVARRAA